MVRMPSHRGDRYTRPEPPNSLVRCDAGRTATIDLDPASLGLKPAPASAPPHGESPHGYGSVEIIYVPLNDGRAEERYG